MMKAVIILMSVIVLPFPAHAQTAYQEWIRVTPENDHQQKQLEKDGFSCGIIRNQQLPHLVKTDCFKLVPSDTVMIHGATNEKY